MVRPRSDNVYATIPVDDLVSLLKTDSTPADDTVRHVVESIKLNSKQSYLGNETLLIPNSRAVGLREYSLRRGFHLLIRLPVNFANFFDGVAFGDITAVGGSTVSKFFETFEAVQPEVTDRALRSISLD